MKPNGFKWVYSVQNTYNKSGRVAKSVEKWKGYGKTVTWKPTTTYSYKAIKVSKDMAAKVKAQQWALLNHNLNFALGGEQLPGILDELSPISG